ncbi:MAG: universal stress protein [Chloroflexi bacterium]|nr:universal stress protein [Chloroflexota bacterium]
MPVYLIVANQTIASPTLAEAVAERVRRGNATFHVVVPATPVPQRPTSDESAAASAAAERLQAVIRRLHDLGAEASGEVGASDPVAAATDATRERHVDEILLSTLPPGLSRWIGMDVPSRLRAAARVRVTVVTAPRQVGGFGTLPTPPNPSPGPRDDV